MKSSLEIRKFGKAFSKPGHSPLNRYATSHPSNHQKCKFPCRSTCRHWPPAYTALISQGGSQQFGGLVSNRPSNNALVRDTQWLGTHLHSTEVHLFDQSHPGCTGRRKQHRSTPVPSTSSHLADLCRLVHAQPAPIGCLSSIFILLQARSFVLWLSLITDDLAVMSFNLPRIN